MTKEINKKKKTNVVKVVKVKMVIFIFGMCHLLTIYKYEIFTRWRN